MIKRSNNNLNMVENETKWLTTFNDLMTLLMVFFVLLFAMSSIDIKKIKHFQHSLQSGLGVLKEGNQIEIGVVQGTAMETSEIEIHEHSISDSLKNLASEPGIKITDTKNGVLITLENNLIFEVGISEINPQSRPVLDKIAAVLKKHSDRILVEGHTDNIPIKTQKFPSNWELSTARAVNVVKYLTNQGNVPPQNLSAVGYGESKPVHLNDTPEHRAMNRRVEIIVEMKKG